MTFRKIDLLYVAFAVLVVFGVSMLPSPKDRNPAVPTTPPHAGLTSETQCATCHGAGGVRALAIPPHPKRVDCLHCHRQNK
ncbi:MAG: hypothetical protein U0172_01805 [Nitrospiraceae bacterium]